MPLLLGLAACLAGFGGLLLQVVLVRRHGLLLGNTAEAASLVLALFLLGLGLGGLWVPRLNAMRRRPIAAAALLYAAVALAILAIDPLLQRLQPQALLPGVAIGLLAPGFQAFLMGAAFPLLFAPLRRGAGATSAGFLIGSNLAGSVAGAFLGGNFGIPELGLAWCSAIAAVAYGFAALVLAVLSRGERPSGSMPPLPRLNSPELGFPRLGYPELAAAAAGFLLLGLEVALLRRLPFFLDGFQPTLSGVIAACLLGLTLGASVGTPFLARVFRRHAVAAALILACLLLSAGMHEWLARDLGRVGVSSDVGFHGRILLATLAAAGLPCFFLGAVIPLLVSSFVHPETRAPLAGRLFFFEGMGALVGALFVGHLLPLLAPAHFFAVWVPALTVPVLLLLAWRQQGWRVKLVWGTAFVLVLVAGALGWSGAGSFLAPKPPIQGSRYDHAGQYRYLAHATDSVVCASVAYNRRRHGLTLFTDEFRAAYLGPDSGYMKVLAHLPFLLRDSALLRRVGVLALGTGTTANAVVRWPTPEEIHVVEISRAVLGQVDRFAGDGPAGQDLKAPFRTDPRVRTHLTDGRRFVARAKAGSLDLISMEPLLPYAPGTVPLYTEEFYGYCARALSEHGLLVQWVPTHSMPERFFRTLLGTFAKGFPHHSLWLCDQSTLLVGSKTPHLPTASDLRKRVNRLPAGIRKDLHEAGLARTEDLTAAFVGAWPSDAVVDTLVDDRPFLLRIGYWSAADRLLFLPDNLRVLAACARASTWPSGASWQRVRRLRLAGLENMARGRLPGSGEGLLELATRRFAAARYLVPRSVLLFREERAAAVAMAERRVARGLREGNGTLAKVPRRHLVAALQRYPDSAFLEAAQALSDPDQRAAVARVQALDPTFFAFLARREPGSPLLALRAIRPKGAEESPLERIAVLPDGPDLVAAATTPSARGFALRRKFPVRVGWALVDRLGKQRLSEAERIVLREAMDPALLDYALRQIQQRDGAVLTEFLPVWRTDLPLPLAFPGVSRLQASAVDRERLAAALAGRRGGGAMDLTAQLLLDRDLKVRQAAHAAMVASFGDVIEFDPQWQESRRRQAAQQLRALHNQPRRNNR